MLLIAQAGIGCSTLPPRSADPSVTVVPAIVRPSASTGPSFDVGEPWLAYQGWDSTSTHIGLVRPDGTGSIRLRVDEVRSTELAHPAWSSTGDRIGFDVYTPDPDRPSFDRVEPWSARPDGSDPQRLAACVLPCLQHAYPAWSPAGDEVAVIRYDLLDDDTWGPSALEVIDLATGTRRVLAETSDGTSALYEPHWSWDGRSIVLAVETYTDATQETFADLAIGMIEVDTSHNDVTIVSPPSVLVREADWDPTGPQIVMTLVDSLDPDMDHAHLAVMDADGTDLRVLEAASGPDGGAFHPSWDPDGRWISFVHVEPSGMRRLARIRPDGTGLDLIPSANEVRTHPRMRPMP